MFPRVDRTPFRPRLRCWGVGGSALGTAQPPIDGSPPSQLKPGHHNNIELEVEPFCHPSLLPSLNASHLSRRLDPRTRTSRHTRQYLSPLRTCKRRQPDSRKSPRPQKKIRRVVLGEMAANDQNTFMLPPKSNASRPKKSIDKKRMHTPSPSKNQRQFPDDAYSPDDIDDAMPCLARTART